MQDDARQSPRDRLLVIVPAFDEAGNVGKVVREVGELPEPCEVVVVDDGSTDATAVVARRAGAHVLVMPFNGGIGASVQAGVLFGLVHGHRRFARLDGDGQHDPTVIARLAEPIARGEADFVLGSRYLEPGGFRSTFLRRLGSRWFSLLLRALCRLEITDPTSGLWVANRKAAEVLFYEHSPDYPEPDSLVHLERSGCRIVERPVRMRPRAAGRSSIGSFDSVYYLFKVTIALIIGRVRSMDAEARTGRETTWNSKPTKQSPS